MPTRFVILSNRGRYRTPRAPTICRRGFVTTLSGWDLRQRVLQRSDQLPVLCLQVLLYFQRLAQDRLGVFEGIFRASVRGGRCAILAHDDDRKQDELEECLCDPGNDAFTTRLQRCGQANQRYHRSEEHTSEL